MLLKQFIAYLGILKHLRFIINVFQVALAAELEL